MAYTPPSSNIYQEFVESLIPETNPLYACILAPQYKLHRFTEDSEKALLGSYDAISGNTFTSWPGRVIGSDIDLASARIFIDDAILQYHTFVAPNGLVVNGGNKVKSSSLIFKTANGYDRSAVYGNRDVAIGDYVKVSWGSNTVETKVMGFVPDTVAATIGSATPASTNAAADTLSVTVVTNIASPDLTVSGDASSYNGLVAGFTSDIYTCTVISTDGTITGTTIRITSASGTDNVSSLVLAAAGVPNNCGTRGAKFTVNEVPPSGSSAPAAFQVGDSWTVEVHQNYTPPVLVSGGSYNGAKDTTYIVSVISGGTVGTDTIVYRVSTSNGYDSSAIDINVTAAGNYVVGNYGVTLTIPAGSKFVTGDMWQIAVTAQAAGPIRTLVLADNLVGCTITDTLTVVLGLSAVIELSSTNWSATTSTITIAAGATYLGSFLGTSQLFPILQGDLYIQYRERLKALTTEVGSITSLYEIPDIIGPIHPDNPLAIMLAAAVTEAEGTPVYYIAVATEDADGYAAACEKLSEVAEVYGLVPYN